ncbi:MAG: class F sortase [Patescibacteria group bacterium]|nr:class F sortase [Patescibacteria group bacterium]
MQSIALQKLPTLPKHQGLSSPLVFSVLFGLVGSGLLVYGFSTQLTIPLPEEKNQLISRQILRPQVAKISPVQATGMLKPNIDLKNLSPTAVAATGNLFTSTPTKTQAQSVTASTHKPSGNPAVASEAIKHELIASVPLVIDIPAIGVHSDVSKVSRTANGAIEVPSGETYNNAAWYNGSPTPGEVGSSVIIGHVDSAKTGPSVFFKLGALKEGDTIEVKRTDGSTAKFTVDAVNVYDKTKFPSTSVYKLTGAPTLTLVTCGGTFDSQSHDYDSNIVVTASLVIGNIPK